MSFFRNIISLVEEVVTKVFAFRTSEIATETSPDFEMVGSVYGGPAISNFYYGYIQIENMFKPVQNDTWEIMCKFRPTYLSNDDFYPVFSNSTGWDGTEIKVKRNKIFVRAYNSQWYPIIESEYDVTLDVNQWYWIKYWYDGTRYKVALSTTGAFAGEENVFCNVESADPLSENTENKMRFGQGLSDSWNNTFNGAIDLKASYIKLNNNYLFNGSTAIENTDYTLVSTESGGSLQVLTADEYAGFEQYSYIKVPVKKPTTSFDMVVKFRTSYLYGAPLHATSEYKGIIIKLSTDGGWPRAWLSSTGEYWDICEGEYLDMNIPTNTDVYLRVKWEDNKYYFGYSTDGTNWTYSSTVINNSNPIYWNDGYQNIGGCSWETDSLYDAIVMPKDCYLKVDNELVWEGFKYPLRVGDAIKINDGMGLTIHKWSAYNPTTTNSNEFTLNSVIKGIEKDAQNNDVYEIDEPVLNKKIVSFYGSKDSYKGYSSTGHTDYYIKADETLQTDSQGNVTNQFYTKAQDGTATPVSVSAKVDHCELASITSTGTQYINTGYYLKANDKVTMQFRIDAFNDRFDSLFGARNEGYWSNCYALFNRFEGYSAFNYARTGNEAWGYESATGINYTVVTQNDTCYLTNHNTGETVSWQSSGTIEDCVNPCAIFTLNRNSGDGFTPDQLSSITLYSFKVEDSNGDLQVNFIPAKDSAGVACLYDTVNETYVYNAGTGVFGEGTVTKTYMTIDTYDYDRNSEIDFAITEPLDEMTASSTDENYNVSITVNQDNLDKLETSAPLTSAKTVIDTATYHTFDYEKLNGYNTTLTIGGKSYQEWEYPIHFTNDMKIELNMVKTSDATQGYEKSFYLSQDKIYKKLTLTIAPNTTVDKITVTVNGSCNWEYTNTSSAVIDVYPGDTVRYVIEKANYVTVENYYMVKDNVYVSNTKTISVNMTRAYTCTINVVPADATIEFVGTNIYKKGTNWAQVYPNSDLEYKVYKVGTDSLATQTETINNETTTIETSATNVYTGRLTDIAEDKTVNITLTTLSEQDITGKADTINVSNYGCEIYKDSNDHYIATAKNTLPAFNNYNYITEDVVLPLQTAASWELQTAYRYMGGGQYNLIVGSSQDNWKKGGIHLYGINYDNQTRLFIEMFNSETNCLIQDIVSEYVYLEPNYEYKFKIGQVLEDNQWTESTGGGQKSTFYIDCMRSDRNSTENIELSDNGYMGSSEYACESSDSNQNAYNAFNSNSNVYSNSTVPTVSQPIWITYYTPTAIRARTITIKNDDTYNNMKNGIIEGSTDGTNWTTLYTIQNRPQCKNLSETYVLNTDTKYNYFRLKITERYADYTVSKKEYDITESRNFNATVADTFFSQPLYNDGSADDMLTFVFDNGWQLNGHPVSIGNYFVLAGLISIVGSVSNNSGIFSNFSSQNYIQIPSVLPLQANDTWEITTKINTTDSGMYQTFLSFGEDYNSKGLMLYLNNENRICFAMCTNNEYMNVSDQTSYTVTPNTDYWVRFKRVLDVEYNYYYYVLEVSTDGTTYENIYSAWESNQMVVAGQQMILGTMGSYKEEYFRGSISNFIVKINNVEWFNSSTAVVPAQNDSITLKYITRPEINSTTATNIKQIVIDGFPFTYEYGYYDRLYTYSLSAAQYNIVDGELKENINYIEKKTPCTSVPLSFLASPISLNSSYNYGHIDLNETKCYINGQLYWTAVKGYVVDDEVLINRGYGLTNDEYTVINGCKNLISETTHKAKVVSVVNDTITATPIEKAENSVTFTTDDSAQIYTTGELPTDTITLVSDTNDVNIKIDTYATPSRATYPNDKYSKVHIESVPGQEITFYLNEQKFVIDDTCPVLETYVLKNNFKDNTPARYRYTIKDNNVVITDIATRNLPDYDLIMLVHTFRVIPKGTTGSTITYVIGDKVYTTTDGSCPCYSGQTINWTVQKQGYITETGSYIVPIYGTENKLFTTEIEMNSVNTLTLVSSEQNSIYKLACTGYEQVNNTITTKRGNLILQGDNIIEPELINNGCTITEG